MKSKYFQKLHLKTVINKVPLYQTSVNLENISYWNQICLKLYERQNLEKINIKVVINMYQCTSVQNFSQFETLQNLEPIVSEKI